MQSKKEMAMKTKAINLAIFLLLGACAMAAEADRKYIMLPRPAAFKGVPFSDGVLVGNTLYIGGHLGIDPKTGKAGITAEEDAKIAMDAVKGVVEEAGMEMFFGKRLRGVQRSLQNVFPW
jgi:enamine deaminase RidA (YjgF/YER057c/UK114 family)